MPVPKKRRSKAKKRTRHACWKIETPNLVACPACAAMIIQHRACPACGVYKGKQVIQIKDKSQKKEG